MSTTKQMKQFLISVVALMALLRASAQVSMELALDQDEFLPNESVRLAVKITNQSGQTMYLGATADWLTFNVESQDGFVVVKNSEVPVVEPFDLPSSQMATKHVNLQPYFQIGQPGRYKVTASMRVKEWGLTVNSTPIIFDVIHGGELWSQGFGVVMASNAAPAARKYTLIKANYLRQQLRLYVQVSNGDGDSVIKVAGLGPLVSFSLPEEEVDPVSRLHVLWQTGAQSFSYAVVGPGGEIVARDTYDNFNSRPHLAIDSNGAVFVRGGVRRPKPDELPQIKSPETVAVPASNP